MAEMQGVPQDRPLRPKILKKLKEEAAKGTFRPCIWATCYCKETKATYRVNGKHSSHVLATLNGKMPKGAMASVEKYECDTASDLARLYASFDYREGARIIGDINKAFAASIPRLAKIPAAIINRCVAGMSYAIWENGLRHASAEERAELLMDNVEFVRWLDTFMKEGGKSTHLRRSAVTAAIYRTYKKDKAAATQFWSAVRDGSEKDSEHPTRKLYRMLIECKAGGSEGAESGKQISSRAMYVKSLHAWNAWRRNTPTNLRFSPKVATPEIA